MMRTALLLFTAFVFFGFDSQSQTLIYGSILDEHGYGLPGANIYLEGTYSGTTSLADGSFSLQLSETGTHHLMVRFMGYKELSQTVNLNGHNIELHLQLRPDANQMEAVVISAGSFSSREQDKVVVMKPLDIVTTAGGNGDLYNVMNTLPGSMVVGEEGKLFVRGGDAYESRTFIDGLMVEDPYSSNLPDLPARGRFSPFQFSGMAFSTGGFSVELGQALSSALILHSKDMPEHSTTSLSLMSVGLEAGHTHLWNNMAIGAEIAYTNLTPYFKLVPQNNDWNRMPEGISGQMNFRMQHNGWQIKSFLQASSTYSSLNYAHAMDLKRYDRIGLKNTNVYWNTNFKNQINKQWAQSGGIVLSSDQDMTSINDDRFNEGVQMALAKYQLKYLPSERFGWKSGVELLVRDYELEYMDADSASFGNQHTYPIAAAFTEFDYAGGNWALRGGVRLENSAGNERILLSPRLSLAYRLAKHSQVSFAGGWFTQAPIDRYLVFNNHLKAEQAMHYILNYQFLKNGKVFRIELYQKNYRQLVRYENLYNPSAEAYQNNGSGYARGFDVFFRDDQSIPNTDYWVSYSYIDSKRHYKDYPSEATPDFVSNHNLSLVGKYWINKWNTQLGMTYRFATGRPYTNPNLGGFLNQRTMAYHDLGFNLSYLLDIWNHFTVIHASVTNLLGNAQVFGYRYSSIPELDGTYSSMPVVPAAKRFYFIGIFMTI